MEKSAPIAVLLSYAGCILTLGLFPYAGHVYAGRLGKSGGISLIVALLIPVGTIVSIAVFGITTIQVFGLGTPVNILMAMLGASALWCLLTPLTAIGAVRAANREIRRSRRTL